MTSTLTSRALAGMVLATTLACGGSFGETPERAASKAPAAGDGISSDDTGNPIPIDGGTLEAAAPGDGGRCVFGDIPDASGPSLVANASCASLATRWLDTVRRALAAKDGGLAGWALRSLPEAVESVVEPVAAAQSCSAPPWIPPDVSTLGGVTCNDAGCVFATFSDYTSFTVNGTIARTGDAYELALVVTTSGQDSGTTFDYRGNVTITDTRVEGHIEGVVSWSGRGCPAGCCGVHAWAVDLVDVTIDAQCPVGGRLDAHAASSQRNASGSVAFDGNTCN